MKFSNVLLIVSAFALAVPAWPADDEVQQLKDQIRRMQEQIDALAKTVAELSNASSSSKPAEPDKNLEQELAGELAANSPPAASTQNATTPAYAPVASARAGSSYMNLSYGAAAVAGWSTEADPSSQLELGDHDPIKRGFSLRNAEIALDGAIDPYFKGFANIVLKLDKNNETDIELEESFLQSTSLPANLQLKAGQYFAAFGRQNPQHPHMWSFVDDPLILTRAFGPEGLRGIGAQLSWLAPTPFYTEFFLSLMDGQGGSSFSFRNPGEPDDDGVDRFAGRATIDRNLRGPQDLLVVPRVATSFELSDTQTVLAGLSAAFGPNDTGPHSRTEIYGADVYWKWKPANASKGFPYLAWQTEVLFRRFEAAADPIALLPEETLHDYGAYTQLVYGFMPRWNAGLRAEYVDGNTGAFDASDPFRGERYRFSPELTFFPSEFSKIRLQYNFDHGETFGDASSVWMQLEFGLGAHAAHKY